MSGISLEKRNEQNGNCAEVTCQEKTTNWKNNNSITTNRKHLLNAYHVPDAVLTTLHLERIKSP